MKLKTKYNINDKVWFMIPHSLNYTWGKINNITVNVCGWMITTKYNIKNRFERKRDYWPFFEPTWQDKKYIEVSSKDVYSSKEELVEQVSKKLQKDCTNEINSLKEFKRGLL